MIIPAASIHAIIFLVLFMAILLEILSEICYTVAIKGVLIMVFQQEFQTADQPEKKHAACAVYHTSDDGSYPLHCHSYYEISYVISGERYEVINGRQYNVRENTLVFIPPLAFHANYNVCATDVAVIQFSPGFLRDSSSEMNDNLVLLRPDGLPPVFSPKKNGETYIALQRIIQDCSAGGLESYAPVAVLTDQFRKNGMVLELVAALLQENCVFPTEGAGISTQSVELDRIIEHILSHPAEKLDMKSAAAMANMSYFAFSRNFKSAVGLNFSDYCNLLRIRFAEDKLISTDMPISDIAAEIGIDTPSYFSRLFRNVNRMTPQEFRNKNRTK